jgi:DNA-binding MarR family transcriptional regulator
MIHMSTIIHVTRTISPTVPADDPSAPDLFAPIIADFRATMTQLKCAMSERVLRAGVSMAQLHVLFTLQRSGEMTMSRLAEMLDVSLSSATGLIDRIEERGFLERDRVPEDRRIVIVRITPAGRRLLDEVDAINDGLLRSVLARVDRGQLSAVGSAFAALRAGVTETLDLPSDPDDVSTAPSRSAPTIDPTTPHED